MGSKKEYLLSKPDNSSGHHSSTALILLSLCAAVLFLSFLALGTWQIQRLYWKQTLIERVEQRAHAPAVAAPTPDQWNNVTAESDEYRHVRVSGVFLDALSAQVQASTLHGRGFWVMTPLRTADGSIIFINRGFITYGAKPCANSSGPIEVTGLLRISEPGGAFLRSNNPDLQQWYSRDVSALAVSKHLLNVAPFFIDAGADKNLNETGEADCKYPVAGLTVIAFHNNHLIYAVTWYCFALMVLVASFIFVRTGLRMRRVRI